MPPERRSLAGNLLRDDLDEETAYDDGYAVTGSRTFEESVNYLTDVGAYPQSMSPYGTWDQGGNVHEWNEDVRLESLRAFRGGSWFTGTRETAADLDSHWPPHTETDELGFRIAGKASLVFIGDDAGAVPGHRLGQPYPNPFRVGSQVTFTLEQPLHVRLSVYDVAGRLIRRLADEPLPSGRHIRRWNGRDAAGREAGAGVYFVRLERPAVGGAETFIETRALVRAR